MTDGRWPRARNWLPNKYGTIGNDTTVNQADFEGLNRIAIWALEKRTNELKKQNEELRHQLLDQNKENKFLKEKLAQLQSSCEDQQHFVLKRLKQLEAISRRDP